MNTFRNYINFLGLILCCAFFGQCNSAKTKVTKKSRVDLAKYIILAQEGDWAKFEVFIRAFKLEEELEVWIKSSVLSVLL